MTLRERLLAELTNGKDPNDRVTQRFRSDMARALDARFSDEEALWKARAEVERRLKVAVQYEKDAALQREEAAQITAAIGVVTGTPSHS